MRARVSMTIAAASVACAIVPGCNGQTLDPYPEALVVVDTNLPVPLVAARLRVDMYAEDGRWFETSDFGRPDSRDWPASFGVFTDDPSREKRVWVRLRAYPEGAVDSYQGERMRDWNDPFARPPASPGPRLVRDGKDVTPSTEPTPLLTVDRMILVPLTPGKRGRIRVLMHGACVGTMVSFGGGAPALGVTSSCVDTAKERTPVALAKLEDDLTTPSQTEAGSWLRTRCPAAKDGDDRVCVEGGATILGSRENTDYLPGGTDQLDPAPPRVFGLSTFFVDRDELTVAALRKLLDAGYSGALPFAYEGTIAQPTTANKSAGCTWSLTAPGRDDYPATCVGYRAARQICQFRGGDVPTEAQWEHIATIAGMGTKQRYPWGSEPPSCERAVWGRIPITRSTAECPLGDGPRPITEGAGDVSGLGIRRLYGSVSEWTRDDAEEYTSSAWAQASLVDPVVGSGDGLRHVIRGASWMMDRPRPIARFAPKTVDGYAPVGMRCVYKASVK